MVTPKVVIPIKTNNTLNIFTLLEKREVRKKEGNGERVIYI